MTATVRVHRIWVTSTGVPADHAVADQEFAVGRVGGVFTAVCGAQFMAASMCAEPGRACIACRQFLEARASTGTVQARLGARRHRARARPSLFARGRRLMSGSRVPDAVTPAPGTTR